MPSIATVPSAEAVDVQLPQQEPQTYARLNRFVAGGTSGIVEVLCTHPVDLVKTRVQESQLSKTLPTVAGRGSIVQCARDIWAEGGVVSMYRGLIPRLIGIMPMRTVYWGSMDLANESLSGYGLGRVLHYCGAGIFAGFMQTLVDNPIEALKIRMMTAKTDEDRSVLRILREAKFPGFSATLVRNIMFAATVNLCVSFKEEQNHAMNFAIGALGGMAGSLISQPADFVKTQMQRTKTEGDVEAGSDSLVRVWNLAQKDPKRLWAGGLSRCIMGFATMGIGAVVYVEVQRLLQTHRFTRHN